MLPQPATLPKSVARGRDPGIDLQGQPANAVTAADAETARPTSPPGTPGRRADRRHRAPLKPPARQRHPLCPRIPRQPGGSSQLTVKFSEWPQPLPVQGGLNIGIQTGEGIVSAIPPPKVWRRLEQAAQDAPALGGGPERVVGASARPERSPPAAERAGFGETGPARGRTRPGAVVPTPTPVPAPTAPATTGSEAKASAAAALSHPSGASSAARPRRGLSRRARDGRRQGWGRAVFGCPVTWKANPVQNR